MRLSLTAHRRRHWPFNPPFTAPYAVVRSYGWAVIAGVLAGAFGAVQGAIALLEIYAFERLLALTMAGVLAGAVAIFAVIGALVVIDFIFHARSEDEDDAAEVVEL